MAGCWFKILMMTKILIVSTLLFIIIIYVLLIVIWWYKDIYFGKTSEKLPIDDRMMDSVDRELFGSKSRRMTKKRMLENDRKVYPEPVKLSIVAEIITIITSNNNNILILNNKNKNKSKSKRKNKFDKGKRRRRLRWWSGSGSAHEWEVQEK